MSYYVVTYRFVIYAMLHMHGSLTTKDPTSSSRKIRDLPAHGRLKAGGRSQKDDAEKEVYITKGISKKDLGNSLLQPLGVVAEFTGKDPKTGTSGLCR